MSKYYAPPDDVRIELEEYIRGIFPGYFADTNIHPCRMDISFENTKGVLSATATLRWQRRIEYQDGREPEYKDGQESPSFSYLERRGKNGREMYWYCTHGLPGG